MGLFSKRGTLPARRDVVRLQLEGALETLETAARHYTSLITVLKSEHWATPFAERPALIQAAVEMETTLEGALAAARRRKSRGDLARGELDLADVVTLSLIHI